MFLKTLILISFLIFSGEAFAAAPAPASPNADKIFQGIVMNPGINARIKQDVADALYRLAKKFPCAAAMKPEIAKVGANFVDVKMRPLTNQLLSQEFSEAELKDIVSFLNTPTGKKIIAKSPEIADRVNQIVMQAALENSGDITGLLARSVNSDGSCKTAQ